MATLPDQMAPRRQALAEAPEVPDLHPAGAVLRTFSARGRVLTLESLLHVLFALLCVVAFAGVAATYLGSLTNYLSVEGDNAIYIILAKALVTGHGYMDIQNPTPRVEAQYPPLFPVLLAPIVAIWGTNGVFQMQVLVTAFTLASFVVAFFVFWRWLDNAFLSFAIVMAAASCDLVWEFSHKILTELPYLFFTLLACLFVTRYATQDRWLTWAGSLAALATVAAFLTRTIGVSLCVAVPLYLLLAPPLSLRDGWWRLRLAKFGLTSAIIAALAGAWTLRNHFAYSGSGRNYLEQFGLKQTYVPDAGKIGFEPVALFGRAGTAISYYSSVYLRMLGGHIWDHVPPSGGVAPALLLVTVLGFIYAVIRRRTVAEFYIAAYVCIVLLWPWTDLRFAVPVIPFLVYYFALALLQPMVLLARWRPIDPRIAAVMILAPLSAPTAIHTFHTAMHDRAVGYHYEAERLGEWPAYADWRDFYAAAMWLKKNAVPGATVIDRSPNLFYLWTGLTSRNYPYSFDRAYVMTDISSEGNDYVLDDKFSWTYTTALYLDPVLKLYRSNLFGPFPIRNAHSTTVYQVIKR